MIEITSEIIEINSGKPGPCLAILAGVHGNEKAGVYALQELLPDIELTQGKVFFAFANPPAIEADVRMLNKNLNRCFYTGNMGTDPEDVRARELMQVLDTCDALLDLHMFYDDDGEPFVICEPDSIAIAQKFDVNVISTNWTAVEPGGTDGYMFTQGKVGICVECGPISKSAEYTDFAKKTVFQFLAHYNMTNQPAESSTTQKRLIQAGSAVFKSSVDFKLSDGFHNFDRLKEGQVIATDKETTYRAGANECIIFPHYKARVGEEAYIIGLELPL